MRFSNLCEILNGAGMTLLCSIKELLFSWLKQKEGTFSIFKGCNLFVVKSVSFSKHCNTFFLISNGISLFVTSENYYPAVIVTQKEIFVQPFASLPFAKIVK